MLTRFEYQLLDFFACGDYECKREYGSIPAGEGGSARRAEIDGIRKLNLLRADKKSHKFTESSEKNPNNK